MTCGSGRGARTLPPNGAGVAGRAGQVAAAVLAVASGIISTGDAASFGYANSVIQYAWVAQCRRRKLLSSQLAGARIGTDAWPAAEPEPDRRQLQPRSPSVAAHHVLFGEPGDPAGP